MDGVDHQKGARAGQSAYTVNGVDITDPVTGNLAFDIPLEAAAKVRTEENPYSAVFGRLTGGSTDLETKGGSNNFKVTAARFFPTFRNTFSGQIDSFRPRVTFSGAVAGDRLFFLQSFEYRFTRTRVPNLAEPGDESTSETFNSFTQFDFNINKTNSAKFIAAFFPEKVRFAGLNTFNPQPTTPNTKQRGLLVSISEQAIFKDASFLSSTLSYKTFDHRPTFLVVLIADDGLTSRAIREHHLECALFGCVSKCVVRPHDVVQREAMSYELARL